jgi:hypothetical protein
VYCNIDEDQEIPDVVDVQPDTDEDEQDEQYVPEIDSV